MTTRTLDRCRAARALAAAINAAGLPVSRLVIALELLRRTNPAGVTQPTTDHDLGATIPAALDFPYSRQTVARARRDLEHLGVISATPTRRGYLYAVTAPGAGGALAVFS